MVGFVLTLNNNNNNNNNNKRVLGTLYGVFVSQVIHVLFFPLVLVWSRCLNIVEVSLAIQDITA